MKLHKNCHQVVFVLTHTCKSEKASEIFNFSLNSEPAHWAVNSDDGNILDLQPFQNCRERKGGEFSGPILH